MTDQKELNELIETARKHGAIVRTRVVGPYDDQQHGVIEAVQVRSGIAGCGPVWMPVIAAAERLRAFVATREELIGAETCHWGEAHRNQTCDCYRTGEDE